MNIGKIITDRRKARGFTQQALAEYFIISLKKAAATSLRVSKSIPRQTV